MPFIIIMLPIQATASTPGPRQCLCLVVSGLRVWSYGRDDFWRQWCCRVGMRLQCMCRVHWIGPGRCVNKVLLVASNPVARSDWDAGSCTTSHVWNVTNLWYASVIVSCLRCSHTFAWLHLSWPACSLTSIAAVSHLSVDAHALQHASLREALPALHHHHHHTHSSHSISAIGPAPHRAWQHVMPRPC
ncbi:hypothetical protein COO60DRAFT_143987 [Scenedesmus sp. NREL 46B-D3]|nr:hypothetical protein COO60DRAFT_143987 [Scenedesmus sp. NREL 46B-D3]